MVNAWLAGPGWHRYWLIAAGFFFGLVHTPGFSAAPGWKPEKPVELIVGVSAGSAHDRTARLIQKILHDQRLVEAPVVIANKPGGGQTIAMSYLSQRPPDGYSVFIASVPLLTANIMGRSRLGYADFTVLAQLFNEYIVLAVTSRSSLRNAKDVIDELRRNPRALSVAVGSSLGNGPHLAISLAMKEGGADIRAMRAVIYSGGADATLAVLGGHVDMLATTIGNILPLIKDGKMRALVVSSPRRLPGTLSGVPTWKEQGIDSVFSSFRVAIGPRGVAQPQLAYWEAIFAKLAETPEWKRDLEANYWEIAAGGSKDTEQFLKTEHLRLQGLLAELGLAK
ncbi:MAG: tripartite tricarboxylate transporter substrate binding protein [Betaproteobacteria bacterium]|nr:tripartite tricarboxylate transporter substrate binding protein [Betaproteobacteria bacterium]